MCRNIGNVERVLRIIVGTALVSMAIVGPENPWFLIGLLPLGTGIIGWCPPYHLLGFSTYKASSEDK